MDLTALPYGTIIKILQKTSFYPALSFLKASKFSKAVIDRHHNWFWKTVQMWHLCYQETTLMCNELQNISIGNKKKIRESVQNFQETMSKLRRIALGEDEKELDEYGQSLMELNISQ